MAEDSFLDTAGGRQQVPDVNIVQKDQQPYTATDGSMQSAVAVNVLSGGIPEDGVAVTQGETVDVLSADGSTQLAQGTADIDTSTDPNTLNGIDLAANLTVAQDGQSVPVQETDGTAIGNGTLNVAGNAITHFTYDGGGSGTALVDGDPVNIDNADGSTILVQGTASVVDGNLVGVLLAQNHAILTDGIGNMDVRDYGEGGGEVAVIARVANNAADVQLANATTKIAVNAAPVQVTAGGKTVGATIAVDQGLWQPFPLANATDAIVSDVDPIPLTNDTGSDRGGVLASVVNNAVTVQLPTKTDLATDQTQYDVLTADGQTTLVSAPANVPISVFHGLLLPADHAVVADGQGSIAVTAPNGTVPSTAAVSGNAITAVNLPATAALVTDGQNGQIPVIGTYTDSVNFTVENGVITQIELS